MESLGTLARTLFWLGAGLMITALILFLAAKWTGWDRLPGDIVYRKENVTLFFPLGTCILVSLIATAILNFIGRK